jgi:hypothetical protein
MKKLCYFPIVFLFPLYLAAQKPDYSSELIERSEKMRGENIKKSAHGSYHHCCHSIIFDEASRNHASLSSKGKAYFKTSASRPVLSGVSFIYNTPNFAIHYTKTGNDAVALSDVNPANTIPDYIDFIASVLDTVYVNDVKDKYSMSPPDGSAGGSAAYDVYIQKLDPGLYGYCQPEKMEGDNPNSTTINETSSMTSYLVMSSDYSWTPSVDISIKVTAAHEFFHAIQFGYASNDSDFLYEATAVWMEDHRYPGLDDNMQYLPDFFSNPDVSLNWGDSDGSSFSGHFYSAWLYFKHMTAYTNDSIIRTIFVNSISNQDMEGIDLALQEYGKNFKTDFQDFLIANLLLIDSLNYPQYSYERAQTYKTFIAQSPYNLSGPRLERTLNYSGTELTHNSLSNGNARLYRLGADYIKIYPDRNCFINLTPNNSSAAIDMVVVAKDTSGNFTILNSTKQGNSYVVDANITSAYQEFTAIVYRPNYNIFNQGSENYSLLVQDSVNSPVSTSPEVRLYPSPASEYFNIETTGFSELEMRIADMMGKVVYTSNLGPGKQVIDANNLSSGIYIVTLKENDQIVFKQKIMVKK